MDRDKETRKRRQAELKAAIEQAKAWTAELVTRFKQRGLGVVLGKKNGWGETWDEIESIGGYDFGLSITAQSHYSILDGSGFSGKWQASWSGIELSKGAWGGYRKRKTVHFGKTGAEKVLTKLATQIPEMIPILQQRKAEKKARENKKASNERAFFDGPLHREQIENTENVSVDFTDEGVDLKLRDLSPAVARHLVRELAQWIEEERALDMD